MTTKTTPIVTTTPLPQTKTDTQFVAQRNAALILGMAALLLVTFVLGGRRLDHGTLWHDEKRTMSYAGIEDDSVIEPIIVTFQRTSEYGRRVVPAYFLGVHYWGVLVGNTPFAVRAYSLLMGLLTLAWVHRLGADLFDKRTGAVAAVLLGTSAFFLFYTHEARMYTQMTAFIAVTLWAYWRIITAPEGEARRWWWAVFGVGLVTLPYTQHYASLTVGSIGLYHLLFAPKNRRWWRVTGLALSIAPLMIPWLIMLSRGLAREASVARPAQMSIAETTGWLLRYFDNGVGVLAVVALIAGLAVIRTKPGRYLWLTVGVTFVGILAVGTQLELLLLDRLRYFLVLWIPVMLACGVGISWLWGRWRWVGAGLVAVWVVVGMWNDAFQVHALRLDGYLSNATRASMEALEGVYQPNDVVAFLITWRQPQEYVQDRLDKLTLRYWLLDEEPRRDYVGDVTYSMESAARLWVVEREGASAHPDADVLTSYIEAEGLLTCGEAAAGREGRLTLYARSEACCYPYAPVEGETLLQFGDIALTHAEPLPEAVTDELPVLLRWSTAPEVPLHTYSVGLHVLDESGEQVAQVDYPLESVDDVCYQVSVPTEDLPPGEYRLMTLVYEWETGERLPGYEPATDGWADRMPLGSFEVESAE